MDDKNWNHLFTVYQRTIQQGRQHKAFGQLSMQVAKCLCAPEDLLLWVNFAALCFLLLFVWFMLSIAFYPIHIAAK